MFRQCLKKGKINWRTELIICIIQVCLPSLSLRLLLRKKIVKTVQSKFAVIVNLEDLG